LSKITYIWILSILLAITNLYADRKWIQIEPINTSRKTTHKIAQSDINISQVQPINKLIEGAQIIKQLIDSPSYKKKPKQKSEKNWYVLDWNQSI